MRILRRAALAGLVSLVPVAGVAGLEICNDTDVRQTVAIGYKADGEWVSEGWWNINADACSTPIKGDLKSRFYYYLSKASGWTFEDENIVFCTTSKVFTITGDENCEGRGYDKGRFRKIDTGKTAKHYTQHLAAFSHPKAPASKASEPKTPAPQAEAAPQPAPFHGAAPGTYGEPYADAVIFQECFAPQGEGIAYCAFHASGTKFFVYDDGRTPPFVFAALRALNPGTPLQVEGDLESIYDITADVVLRDVTVRPWSDLVGQLELLQGQWYAMDDPNAQFTVLGAERTNTYGGAFTGLEYLSVQTWCDSYQGADYYLSARDEETGEYYCYSIEHIGERDMTLMYLPGGNFLDYIRLD